MNFDENGVFKSDFNAGNLFNNNIRSGVIQSDGKILLGGNFTSYDGFPRNRIIRLKNGFAPEIEVLPNPTSDSFSLIADLNSHWLLTDTSGKILMEGQTKTPNVQIDIRSLTQGIYILHLTDPQRNKATKRIVKQ